MRIVITVPCLSGGGAEFVAWQWARYLAGEGDHVTVYTTHSVLADATPEGVSLVKAPQGGVVAQARNLATFLRNEPADVVVALMPYCNLVTLAAARSMGSAGPLVVISEHIPANGPSMVYAGAHQNHVRLARRIYRSADLLVAVSHAVGAEAISEYGISMDKVAVVPNPAFAKLQNRHVKRPGGIPQSARLDLVVPGRLVPQKRPLLAVDVAAILSPHFPGGVTLHFYGAGPLIDQVVSHASDAGVNAVMHGWVENWFDECPAGSIVLVTSVLEGFGNVLIEAAAAGFRSVVSSKCMGVADAVIPGLTGELTTGNTAEDYAAAVLRTPRTPVCGIEPWLQRFTFESSGQILRDELTRIMQRPPRSDR
jgi:glycosyltransferase involved in cell wall biosynthesis